MRKISVILTLILLNAHCKLSNAAIFISMNQLLPKKSPPPTKELITKSLRLQGIIAGKKNYAIINGKIYKPFDKIDTCIIYSIIPKRRKVILKCFNRIFELKLSPMKEVSE